MVFSVIVPFLNEAKRVEACLKALLAQQFDQDYELIFIDNGSTDRSVEIVQSYPVTLFHEPVRDPYIARNRGIRAARGKYIAFTDADCIVKPDWLTWLYHSFEAEGADIVIGRLLYPQPVPLALECHENYYHIKLQDICRHKRAPYYYGHAGNMAVRASVFEQVGLFSGMPVVGDTEIIHNLIQSQPDAAIVYEPRAEVIHTEVTRLRHYLYKQFECGQYSETYSTGSSYRPLRFRDNLRLARATLAAFQYGLWKQFIFAYSLVTGYLAYKAGRLLRKWQ